MTPSDLKLFYSTFALIFISELPDKTAFASVLLATRNRPLAVFFGACGAFVVQSVVAVAFGSVISLLPARIVHTGAGVLFLVFAVMMWRRRDETPEASGNTHSTGFLKGVVASFLVIFAAEWGDLTQLATATLAAKYKSPLIIFSSATLALWVVTGIAVIVGYKAKAFIAPKVLQRVAAIAFAGVGLVMLARIYF
jgi:putative Ca2+/H+ antiporter (TMEM165/GDT1 family)